MPQAFFCENVSKKRLLSTRVFDSRQFTWPMKYDILQVLDS